MLRSVTTDDLNAAWEAVHDATPPDWHVGRPSYHDERTPTFACLR